VFYGAFRQHPFPTIYLRATPFPLPAAQAHRGVRDAVSPPALWAIREENPSGIPIPRTRVNKTEKYATGLYTNPYLPDRLVTTATYMKLLGSGSI